MLHSIKNWLISIASSYLTLSWKREFALTLKRLHIRFRAAGGYISHVGIENTSIGQALVLPLRRLRNEGGEPQRGPGRHVGAGYWSWEGWRRGRAGREGGRTATRLHPSHSPPSQIMLEGPWLLHRFCGSYRMPIFLNIWAELCCAASTRNTDLMFPSWFIIL